MKNYIFMSIHKAMKFIDIEVSIQVWGKYNYNIIIKYNYNILNIFFVFMYIIIFIY